jgi:hypothetical protein
MMRSDDNESHRFEIIDANGGYDKFAIYPGNTGNIILHPSGAGKVGIGTTAPTARLSVFEPGITVSNLQAHVANFVGDGYQTAQVFVGDSATIAADVGGEIQFGGKYSGNAMTEWAACGGYKENATSGQYGGYFAIKTRPHAGSPTERMRIQPDGKVGIGTETPTGVGSRLLHIQGSSTTSAELKVQANWAAGLYIENGDAKARLPSPTTPESPRSPSCCRSTRKKLMPSSTRE